MPLTLDDLRGGPGAHRAGKRVGRGHGSGKGKTAGRGTKGQKSRSGPGVGRGFEGGQLPIQQRLPYKRGFTNIYRTPWEVVNVGRLEQLEIEGPITPEAFSERGVIRGRKFPVKVLADGELTRSIVVHAHAFSRAAKEAIENAGGSVVILERNDEWLQAKPRTRRPPLNRQLKGLRVGKVGGPRRQESLAALGSTQES